MLFIFDYKTLWAPFMVQLRKRFNSRRLISKSMEQSGIKPQGRRFKSYLRSQKKHDVKVMLLFFLQVLTPTQFLDIIIGL